jgi:uncharacterized membrane protein
MLTENAELMRMARESLREKWGLAIGTFLLYILFVTGLQAIKGIGPIVSLIISGPLSLGISIFSLNISRNREARLEQIFLGFNNFATAFAAYLLMVVFIILWMLLLIVPGIIAALSYSMTFYILADDGSIKAMEAIDKSKKMMNGYKWKYFRLCLRFLGWALLCIPTLGIGFLWLIPWINVSSAKFYEDIKANPIII